MVTLCQDCKTINKNPIVFCYKLTLRIAMEQMGVEDADGVVAIDVNIDASAVSELEQGDFGVYHVNVLK